MSLVRKICGKHSSLFQRIFLFILLHIELGLMQYFLKAMNKSVDGFKYLQNLFHELSFAKVNERIYIEPNVRKLIVDSNCVAKLNEL